ncbi:protein suppressor of sable [Ischnura elegans]|uniref:protein suppressor of sable n=1 Tax=Ischnura elegans TaxID=197161 RepID=UPI001ED8AB1B|nr:protein suppressor of sable [Ischnura elegans]
MALESVNLKGDDESFMADDLEDGEILDEDDEAVGNISSSGHPEGVDTKANDLGGGVDGMGLSVCQSLAPAEKLQNDDSVQPDAGNVERGVRRESRDGVDNHMLSDDDAHRKRKKRKKRHRESDDEDRPSKESKRQKRSHHRSRRGGDEQGRTVEDDDDDEMMMFVRGASPTASHHHHHQQQGMADSPQNPAMAGGHGPSAMAARRDRKGSVRPRRSSPLLQTPPEYMAQYGDANASSTSSPMSRSAHNARHHSRSPHNHSFRRVSRSPTVGHDGGQYDEHYESYESDYEREGGPHFRRGMGRAEDGSGGPRRGMEDRLLRKRRGGGRGGRGGSLSSPGGALGKRLGRKEKRGGGGRGSEGGGLLGKARRGGGPERSGSICMFYMQGKCQKVRGESTLCAERSTQETHACIAAINPMNCNQSHGEDCPYSHDAVPPRKLELCKFYLMDCCAKKDKCLYMHKDFPCKYFHTGMKCFSGDKCKFSHGPLNETLKAILLKHLETAPKEILGDFPRLTREGAAAMVQQQSANMSGNAAREAKKGEGRGNRTGEGREDGEEDEEARSDNGHGNGKIPSLFEIDIPMPEDGQEERGKEGGSSGAVDGEKKGGGSDNDGDGKGTVREKRRKRRHRHHHHHHHHRGGDSEDSVLSDHEDRKGQREEGTGRGFVGGGIPQQEPLEQQPVDLAEEDDDDDEDEGGGDLSIVCEDEEEEEGKGAEENGIGRRRKGMEVDEEEGGDNAQDPEVILLQPPDDESKMKADSQGGDAESGNNSPVIPLHLPKKQRELFIRIQQQQRGADSSQSPSADNNDDEEEGLKEESWYSSDEEAEDRSLTDVLKNLSKQPPSRMEKSTPTTVESLRKEQEQSNDSNSSASKLSLNSGAKVLETLSLSDLSKIKISADISKLLSSIRESTSSALSGGKSPTSAINELSAASDVDSRPQAARDPRRGIPRDPRQQRGASSQNASEVPKDPRKKPGMMSPQATPIAYPNPMLSDHGDVDLRQLPEGDVDLRALVGKPRDTDLRSNRPFGDTDLRRPGDGLGLPFRPVAPPEPATEIDASLNSHPPIPFRLIPVSPRDGHDSISSPRSSRESLYSQLPRGFLPLSDSKVQNDPRLRKIMKTDDSTANEDGNDASTGSTVPSASASPAVAAAPRTDPRRARQSSQSSHASPNPQSPPTRPSGGQPKDPRSKAPPPQQLPSPPLVVDPTPVLPAQDPRLATRAMVLEPTPNKLPLIAATPQGPPVFHPGAVNSVGMGNMVMSPGHMNPAVGMNHMAPAPMNPVAMGMNAMNTMGAPPMNMNPNMGMGMNPGGARLMGGGGGQEAMPMGGGMMHPGMGGMMGEEMGGGVRRPGGGPPLLMDPPMMQNFGEMGGGGGGEDDGGGGMYMVDGGPGMYGGGGMCNVGMMGDAPMPKGPRGGGSRGFFRGRGGGGRGRGGRGWRGEGRGWRGDKGRGGMRGGGRE